MEDHHQAQRYHPLAQHQIQLSHLPPLLPPPSLFLPLHPRYHHRSPRISIIHNTHHNASINIFNSIALTLPNEYVSETTLTCDYTQLYHFLKLEPASTCQCRMPCQCQYFKDIQQKTLNKKQQGFIGYRFGISRFRKISTETENNNQIEQIKAQHRVLYRCDLKESDRN